jgi:hypothetical protein
MALLFYIKILTSLTGVGLGTDEKSIFYTPEDTRSIHSGVSDVHDSIKI